MAIYYSGSFKRSGGILSAITKQVKLANLKPVKRIEIQFDPFHPQAVTARDFMFHITNPKVTETNYNCSIKANIVCDRSEPQIKVDLLPDQGPNIKFLIGNLSVLEIFEQFNKHVSSLVKPDEIDTKVIATKSEKKKQFKRK